jgi:hypothetical protein
MLFLVLNQHFNRPAFEIVGYNGFYRSGNIVGDKSDAVPFSSASRKDNLNGSKTFDKADTLGKTVAPGCTQTGYGIPSAAVVEDVSAIFAQLVLLAANREPSVGFTYSYIMPASLFAGIGDSRTHIIGVEQNGNSKIIGQLCRLDSVGGKFCEFFKGHLQFFDVLAFDVYTRSPGYGNTAIVQTDLEYSMADSVFTSGVVKQFADSGHFLGTFEGLSVINDKKQIFILTSQQASQHIEGNFLHYNGLVPCASPQEFAMIGAMGAVSQQPDKSVNRTSVTTNADCQYHRPEVAIDMLGNLPFDGLKKSLDFLWNCADGNHTASMLISTVHFNTYRQKRLFLFDDYHYNNLANRSV